MSSIKERPILFSGPMVRAILEGRKTVTRRPVKGAGLKWLEEFTPEYVANPENGLCPYGKPGERLWVRETFNSSEDCRPPIAEPFIYAADLNSDGRTKWAARWKPSIHMPRIASRILLEITDVRVERLQDISEDQAEAEGVGFLCAAPDFDETLTAKQLFEILWEHINGAGAWDANPWVWVVEFKRVTP